MSEQAGVKLDDLEEALSIVGGGMGGDAQAWVCRATGAVIWYSEEVDDLPPLPKDIDDETRYVPVPDKRELGLGKPSALEFTRTHLPECEEQVYGIFSHRGAYARFKSLLEHHDCLDAWYQWETEQTRQALRDWCKLNGLTPAD